MPIPPARLLTTARTLSRRAHAPRSAGRRGGAVVAVLALLTGLLVALAGPAAADPTPPPNPSDAQIGAAAATKAQLATQVGALTAQLSQLQVQVQQLQAAAELAEQNYAYAVQKLQDATAAAATAKQGVKDAQAAVDKARTAFNASVRAGYQQSSLGGGGGALLTSDDPDDLMQASAFQAYVTSHQVDGIGQLDRATVAKANADAKARTAVATQTQLTAAAAAAATAAKTAEEVAQQQQAALATQTTAVQAQLDTAQAALLGLQNQRAAYDAWKAEQARIEAAREAAAAAALLQQQQAEAARLAAQQGQSSGSSGGGGGGGSTPAPSGGSWTPAKGQDAANRALNWVNTPYAFAGGNRNGPTYGVCQSGAAYNDCHVYGFDCSGLSLYAWAPYLYMDHYAATQYRQVGRFHPSTSQLQPGDLLFYGGSASTIHHVAIYIGNAQVVQAPQSGDHVRVTSIYNMGSDYYGATRPLS